MESKNNNCYIGKKYPVPREKFDKKKFLFGLLNVVNPVLWVKDFVSIFNFRKIIIYLTILGFIFGYGYFQGQQGKPIKLDVKFGKAYIMRLNGNYLEIQKDGKVAVLDKNKNLIKYISVKDIPELNKRLRPYGVQLKPKFIAGLGYSSKDGSSAEVGAGVSIFRLWKQELDLFLTNKGIYVGTSYQVTDNFGIGIGAGHGYSLDEDDFRAILYGSFKF